MSVKHTVRAKKKHERVPADRYCQHTHGKTNRTLWVPGSAISKKREERREEGRERKRKKQKKKEHQKTTVGSHTQDPTNLLQAMQKFFPIPGKSKSGGREATFITVWERRKDTRLKKPHVSI